MICHLMRTQMRKAMRCVVSHVGKSDKYPKPKTAFMQSSMYAASGQFRYRAAFPRRRTATATGCR